MHLLFNLSIACLYTKYFYYLINALTFQANIYIKKKDLVHLVDFLSLAPSKKPENNISHTLISR